MLKIQINTGENIEKALKRYKQKFNRTGIRRKLQSRKQYAKPSIVRRQEIQKAEYVQSLKDAEQI